MFRLISLYTTCFLIFTITKSQPLSSTSIDSISIDAQLQKLWKQGYIFSRFDSLGTDGVAFYQGERYTGHLSELKVFNNSLGEFERIRLPVKDKIYKEVYNQLERYTNSGYPFAKLIWDSIRFEGLDYFAFMTLLPGPQISYDSIVLLDQVDISQTFVSRVIDSEFGAPFSESAFRRIPARISGVDFLQLTKPPDVAFEADQATIYLSLKEIQRNSFEGVVGLLPGQSADAGLAFTGFLDLQLANLFRSGKEFGFSWNRFANASQSLDLHFKYPYFLGSKLFVQGDFNLLKQDTTFLNQSWELLSGFPFSGISEFYFGFNNSNGTLISPNGRNIEEGLSDYRRQQYFLGIRDGRYGRPMAWTNTMRYRTQVSLGDKSIIRNPAIDSDAYDTIKLQTTTFQFRGSFEYQLTFGQGSAFYHDFRAEAFFNDQVLENEISRLGGLKTVRGFNENFFYAQHFLLNRFELRQYFEERSYLSIFTDQLLIPSSQSRQNHEYAHGYGLGLSLDTTNGLFTFAAALGRSSNVPFNPANVKIHIGYISTF